MFKKLFTAIAIISLTFSALAQNARIDAMGGCNIVDDITRVLNLPAYMNDFTDQIQGTAASSSFGPSIGIKSFGNMLNVGIMAIPVDYYKYENLYDVINPNTGEIITVVDIEEGGSRSTVLRSNFYNDAKDAFEFEPVIGDDLPSSFPPIPHLIFGLDFNDLAFGLDFFLELTRHKSVRKTTDDEITNKQRISNIGAILSANIELENLTISPLVGAGFPRVYGLNEVKGPVNSKTEVESKRGSFVTGGIEIGFEGRSLLWTAGGFYTNETYQFKTTNIGKLDEYSNHFIDMYIGFVTEILGNLLLVTQYNFSVLIANQEDNTSGGFDYSNNVTTHTFGVGLERPIEGFWIFDNIIPRTGMSFQMSDSTMKRENSTGPKDETTTRPSAWTTDVVLTVGVGITKGIATLDFHVNYGYWLGLVSGPDLFKATLTLDFGKTTSSPGYRSETLPSSYSKPGSRRSSTVSSEPEPPSTTSPEPESSESSSKDTDLNKDKDTESDFEF